MRKGIISYRKLLYWGGLLLIVSSLNLRLLHLNHIVDNGKTVLVPLYFAEKSDFDKSGYMNIRYENIIPDTNMDHKKGSIVISTDINKVAIYSRFNNTDMPVEAGEMLLQYQIARPFGFFSTKGMVKVSFGADKFYFKDYGLLEYYMRARYTILKVAEDGSTILYGLADMNHQELGTSF